MRKLQLLAVCIAVAVSASDAHGGDAAAGEARYAESCVTCHGRAGKGMASFPAIVGRDADYIEGRLRQYRAREQVGPNSALMMSWAETLSDDEISDLAAYISTAFQ